MPQAATPTLARGPTINAGIAQHDDMRAAREALKDPSLTMTQLMKALNVMDSSGHARGVVRVGISSSVTVDLLATYLRKCGDLKGNEQ